MFPYIIQGNNITVVIDSKPHTIAKSLPTFNQVVEAIKADDWDKVRNVIEPKKVVLNYGKSHVSVQGETLYWKGEVLHNALSIRMIQMLQEGFPIEPMVNFMENLMQNPSKRSVTELYGFLEKNNLPITPDGHFLAYKKVRENYLDVHSGTMDNSVGKVVELERNKVDDDKDRTCSTGLHFCSESYLTSFSGARTVIVKINPRDVVSIPSDYNDSKGRACRYEVVGEIVANSVPDAFTKSVQSNAEGNIHSPSDVSDDSDDGDDGVDDVYDDQSEVDSGNTPYHHGYHDGYHDNCHGEIYSSSTDSAAYVDGFNEGEDDSLAGSLPKYQFVK